MIQLGLIYKQSTLENILIIETPLIDVTHFYIEHTPLVSSLWNMEYFMTQPCDASEK